MQKVFVGLSGGVDSSVSAYLLKKAGYDVTGVFIKAWYPEFYPCNWRDEMRDAMRICAKLEIPFLICDLEKEYKKEVVDYLIEEYKSGNTPNPDVMCNKKIKFDGFLNFALKNGADFVATGHYAKRQDYSGIAKMFIPKDTEKDQTYFLWTLTQEKMQKILFPLGELSKKEVRKIASKNNLHTASKKDSQGLCFIGHVDIANFLKHFIEINPGKVLDTDNNVIGQHEGAVIYTLGQRHGFTIFNKDSAKNKMYVISKNLENNTITVAENFAKEIVKNKITLKNISFIREIQKSEFKDLNIRIRYRANFLKGTLIEDNDQFILEIQDLNENVASGQSVVMYKGQECIGGGVVC